HGGGTWRGRLRNASREHPKSPFGPPDLIPGTAGELSLGPARLAPAAGPAGNASTGARFCLGFRLGRGVWPRAAGFGLSQGHAQPFHLTFRVLVPLGRPNPVDAPAEVLEPRLSEPIALA